MYNFETWRTAKGEWIDVVDMTQGHINNTIKLLRKKPDIIQRWCDENNINTSFAVNNQIIKNYAQTWISVFETELKRREVSDIETLIKIWEYAKDLDPIHNDRMGVERAYTAILNALEENGLEHEVDRNMIGCLDCIFVSWIDKNGKLHHQQGWRSSGIRCKKSRRQ